MTQGLLINDGVKEMSLYGRPPKIRVERLGSEGSPVVIVENFAPDPDALAALAETLTFEKIGEFYPGMRTRVPPSYFASTAGLTAAVIRNVFKSRDSARVDRALYSIATTPSADLTLAQRIPHIDSVDDGAIAIVHYLARRDFGGAAFYRRRSTGLRDSTGRRSIGAISSIARFCRMACHCRPPRAKAG